MEDSNSKTGVRRALRIALVSPPLNGSGGIGRLMSYVLEGLDSQQVAVRHIDTRGQSSRPILTVFPLLRASLLLIGIRASRRVDLVHINMSYRGSTIRKGVIAGICRVLRIPTILHLHACEYPEYFERLSPVFKRLVRNIFQGADHVIVLGRFWRTFVVDELGIPEDNVSILYNAAPGPAELSPRDSATVQNVRLLFLGRLGARKGVPELLSALSGIPELPVDWSITMAGDGDINGTRESARRLGILHRMKFTGWLDSAQVRDLLEDTDLLILPSYAEGFPMAIVEAFAHGVAVISSPIGAIPELVVDGETGLLVSPGDVDGLERAIELLCLNSEFPRGTGPGRTCYVGRPAWH